MKKIITVHSLSEVDRLENNDVISLNCRKVVSKCQPSNTMTCEKYFLKMI